jgi:predicted alpha/beta-fold hydrolase
MFNPSFFLQNRHIQTLFATFFRKEKLEKVEEEYFTLPDGDFVESVWHNRKPNDTRPIVVIFHGLAGSVKSPYVIGVMKALEKKGFASVLMHFRGCGRDANLKPRAYHSGDTADAKAFIEHLHKSYPFSSLYAVGFSIGGNMLLKLLGEWEEKSLLKSAVSVSAPLNLSICADTIEKGFAKNYQNYLLQPLKKSLLQKYEWFEMEALLNMSQEEVANIKTIREFDEKYTAKIHGFKGSQDYYAKCSAKQFLKNIKIPTLIIHALDDPFMTVEILPKSDEVSKFITLEISKYGGHVGFVTGTFKKPIYWLDEKISSFFLNSYKEY